MKKIIATVFLIAGLSGCSGQGGLSVRKVFKDVQVRKLADAAAKGDVNAIDTYLSKGVDINSIGKEGVTPLAWALLKQDKVGFEYLLKCGANPNVRMDDGDTLLFYAIKMDDPFFLEMALKYGGDPNQRKKWIDGDISLLWYSLSMVTPIPDKMRVLIKYGADVHEQDSGGVVSACAMMNHYEGVYIFIKSGASFSTNREPSSLLYCLEDRAVHPDDPEYAWRNKVVAFLRERGIEVTPKEWKREDQPTIINVQTQTNSNIRR